MSTINSGNTFKLLSLSTEVLLYILTFLDGRDIIRFSSINRAFFNLYKESFLLQSLVQLDICGAEACLSPRNVSPRERLSYMMARESMWLRIPSPPELVLIHKKGSGLPAGFRDFDEGVFLFGLRNLEGGLHGNEQPYCRAVKALQFSHDMQETLWRTFAITETSEELQVVHTCLSIQEHDLMAIFTLPRSTYEPDSFNIILSLRVHLLQFSTGNPHPLATSHIIHVQQMRKSVHLPSAAISGHKLFVHSPRWAPIQPGAVDIDFVDESIIRVFDWMTGDCLFSLCEQLSDVHFALLPEDIIVTSLNTSGCLRFSRLTQSGADTNWRMQWFTSLELPRTTQYSLYSEITFRSHHKPNGPLHSNEPSDSQLIFSPRKGLLGIIAQVVAQDFGEETFHITIHSEAIMRCAGVLEAFDSSRDSLHEGARTVPWPEWGAKYAHFERIRTPWWENKVDHFGQRQALLLPHPWGFGNELYIRNYNPTSVSYHLSHPLESDMEVITGERRCSRGPFFEEDVVWSLSFVQTNGIPRSESYEKLFMDRDHLVFDWPMSLEAVDLYIAAFKPR